MSSHPFKNSIFIYCWSTFTSKQVVVDKHYDYSGYVRGLDSYRTFCHFYFEEECSFSGLVVEEEGSGCLDLWMTKKAVGDKAPANN